MDDGNKMKLLKLILQSNLFLFAIAALIMFVSIDHGQIIKERTKYLAIKCSETHDFHPRSCIQYYDYVLFGLVDAPRIHFELGKLYLEMNDEKKAYYHFKKTEINSTIGSIDSLSE